VNDAPNGVSETDVPSPAARVEPPGDGSSGGPLLSASGISKRFGGVQALRDVSIDFYAAEVHGLVGENGAGKSTLVKTFAGAHTPDSGQIIYKGEPVHFTQPKDSIAAGISVIYQELHLLPLLTICENMFLGHEPRSRGGFLDDESMREHARRVLADVGATLDPDTVVERLTIAERQLVEIAKALTIEASVLIMDEPTASLSAHEAEHLMTVVGHLRERGVVVIYISHALEEVFRLADRVSVLKDGQLMMSRPAAETHADEVVSMMVGRSLGHVFPQRPAPQSVRQPVLEVKNLTVPGRVDDVSFTLHAGEIVGFAGLVGAGRTDVALALFGSAPVVTGEVIFHGTPTKIGSPRDAIPLGIGFVPEDRKVDGLVLNLPIRTNISLPQLKAVSKRGVLNRKREVKIALEQVEALRIRTPSVDQAVENLSGGNQQKVVLGKWLALGCSVLILDEPTAGIDVGAKVEIYQLIRQLADNGAAIMLISSELPEILGLSDEIIVMSKGRIVARRPNEGAREEDLIRAALGLAPAVDLDETIADHAQQVEGSPA
jgi:ABC-type sugar transport system ATPase subunit